MRITRRYRNIFKKWYKYFLLIGAQILVLCCNPERPQKETINKLIEPPGYNNWSKNLLSLDHNSILVKFIAIEDKNLFAATTKSLLRYNGQDWDICFQDNNLRLGEAYTNGRFFLTAVTSYDSHNQSISKDKILYGELYKSKNGYRSRNIKIFESPFSENVYGFHLISENTVFVLGLCEYAILYLDKKDTSGNFKFDYYPILENPASDFHLIRDNISNIPIVYSKDALYKVKLSNNKYELEKLFTLPERELVPGKISYPYQHIKASGNSERGFIQKTDKLFYYKYENNNYKISALDSLTLENDSKISVDKINEIRYRNEKNVYCSINDGRILHLKNNGNDFYGSQWEVIYYNPRESANEILSLNDTTIALHYSITTILTKKTAVNKNKLTHENSRVSRDYGLFVPIEYYATASFYGIGVGHFVDSSNEGLYVVDLYDLNKYIPKVNDDLFGHYYKNESSTFGLAGRIVEDENQKGNYDFDVGTSVADINEDGYDDILLSNLTGSNSLLINNGKGFFRDVTIDTGLDSNMYRSEGIICADINNDGWLDIFSTSFLQSNRLFLNNTGNSFEDITETSGLKTEWGSISAQFADINNDGLPDLYVCNWIDENRLYLNLGNGKFKDITKDSGVLCGFGKRSNSVTFADFNNDGLLDLFIGNRGYTNKLFQNIGECKFVDISEEAGINQPSHTYGVATADFDNDSFIDLAVTNKNRIIFYKNCFNDKGKIWFKDVTKNWLRDNDNFKSNNVAIATVDFHIDGDMDLIVTQSPGSILKLHNTLNENANKKNFILVKVNGSKSNRNGVGVKLSLFKDDRLIGFREINAGSGYASCGTKIQHFGLGNDKGKYKLLVEFPKSKIRKFITIKSGSIVVVNEYEGLEKYFLLAEKNIISVLISSWTKWEVIKIAISLCIFFSFIFVSRRIVFSKLLPHYFAFNKFDINLLFISYLSVYVLTRIIIFVFFYFFPDNEAWINTSPNKFFNHYLPFITSIISIPILLPIIKDRNIKKLLAENMLGKLITKLHEFHHGESSAMCLNRLSLFLKNYKEIDPKDVETIRRFNLVIDEFINITSKDILQLGDLGYEFLTVYKVNKYYNKGNDLKSKLVSSVDYLNRLLVDIRKQTNDDFIKPNVAEQIVNTIDKIRRNIKEINLSINESISSSLTEVLNNIREKYSGNTNYPVNISYDQLTINDIKVIIPKEELEKVLVIILQNSFESYLTKDALLQVQMTVTKIDNNVCIKIEDFGTGIKKEDLSRIYEKGFTTKSKGHGFGLYFVKSTLENYGGKIEVDSEYGAGTRVTIYLCVG